MSKLRIFIIAIMAACLAVCLTVGLAACGKGSGAFRTPEGGIADDGSFDPESNGGTSNYYYPAGVNPDDFVDEDNSYIVSTLSLGGTPLRDVRVTLSDGTAEIASGVSSSSGRVVFPFNSGSYTISYSNLPAGYSEGEGTVKTIDENNKNVISRFTSSVISESIPTNFMYGAGDIMYDFSVTDGDGVTMTLSEVLQDKELVIINFFYTQCGPCASEFPALNSAYLANSDDVAVIALADPRQSDTVTAVKNYKSTMSLGFFMALDSISLTPRFGVTSYPTTIFVDRYGVVCSAHVGAVTEQRAWESLISGYLGDDYSQNITDSTEGGDTGEGFEYKKPPEGLEKPSDDALNAAFTDNLNLEFFNETEMDDSEYYWPFTVSDNGFLAPSNVGQDATYSAILTSVPLNEGDTLTVDIRYETEVNDALYIFVNDAYDADLVLSGSSAGWQTLTLYTANRQTTVSLTLMFLKNGDITIGGELVELRNLKITSFDESTVTAATDVEKSLFSYNPDGTLNKRYDVVYNADDGFYHVVNETGPLLLVDMLGETMWMEYRVGDYVLQNTEGENQIKSFYNMCYWALSNAAEITSENNVLLHIDLTGDTARDNVLTNAVLEGYYAQAPINPHNVPVTQSLADAMKEFVKKVHNDNSFGDDKAFDENTTWLELCSFIVHYGADHPAGSICYSYDNPSEGLNFEFAHNLTVGETVHVNTAVSTWKNRAGGQFYKIKAEEAGVYELSSIGTFAAGSPVDPKVYLWAADSDAFHGSSLAEVDDSLSLDRFDSSNRFNFKVLIYLEAGETVYAQLTLRDNSEPGAYDAKLEYLGEEYWNLEIATTGEGAWSYEGDDVNDNYYLAVSAVLSDDNLYHHYINGEPCSVMYIDFLRDNLINGYSIEYYVEHRDFSSIGEDKQAKMAQWLSEATAKEPDDELYGMLEASAEMVQILSEFMDRTGEGFGVSTHAWEAFAFYYHYYGPTDWVEKPQA